MYDELLKRVFDVTVAVTLLVFLIPVFCVLWLAVKLDSQGPFIFATTRIGKNTERFTIYKVRTMQEAAGLDANDENTPYVTTAERDPRITRVGFFLRKYHLDELPQIINVLIGDMSLVGVRPDAPSQVEDYEPYVWIDRHLCRPGLTGLSQIHSGKPGFDLGRRNKYDLHYVRTKGKLRLDSYFLYRTFFKAIKGSSF